MTVVYFTTGLYLCIVCSLKEILLSFVSSVRLLIWLLCSSADYKKSRNRLQLDTIYIHVYSVSQKKSPPPTVF